MFAFPRHNPSDGTKRALESSVRLRCGVYKLVQFRGNTAGFFYVKTSTREPVILTTVHDATHVIILEKRPDL